MKQHVAAAVEAGADLIISGAGLPTELPALTAGSPVKIAPIVSTEKSAKVILKYWGRQIFTGLLTLLSLKVQRPAAILGLKKKSWSFHSPERYEEEITKIIETVRGFAEEYQTEIPIIAAGGIFDVEDVRRVMALGVDRSSDCIQICDNPGM